MKPYAAAPLPFMTGGCSAGRAPVRVPMAEPLPRRSGLADSRFEKQPITRHPDMLRVRLKDSCMSGNIRRQFHNHPQGHRETDANN